MRARIMNGLSKCMIRLRRSLAGWPRDTRGVGAVEFAMIAPLMLVMFFGMIDVSMGVGADRKVTIIAQAMADLTSRNARATDTDIANFIAIGDAMVAPYPTADLTVTISQVYVDAANNGVGKVYWSKGDKPLDLTKTVTVPAGLISKDASGKVIADQYLILAEVTYAYKPIIGYVVPKAGLTLTESTYTRPRKTMCVYYSAADNCK